MKKLILLIAMLLPLYVSAQNTWEVPEQQTVSTTKSSQTTKKAKKRSSKEDPKYLKGAVTTDENGNPVFTADFDATGLSAQQVYDRLLTLMGKLTKEEGQLTGSKIALVDKDKHTIVTSFKENLVFQSTALSLDQSEFHYVLILTCTDGHAHAEMSRLYYLYELDREGGFKNSGKNVITDEWALNKKGTRLAKYYGKFRRATIDRKDQLFNEIAIALK